MGMVAGLGKALPGASHIYITKGQNWKHWCNGLFIRTSLNRFWLSSLLLFQICSHPLPAQRAQPPPAQPSLTTWPPLTVFTCLAFQYQPAKAAGSCHQMQWAPSAPHHRPSLWVPKERVLRFSLLVPHSGRPGLPWNGARMGEEASSSLEPIPACPSPTPRAREAQQVPQECDQTRGAGWLRGLSSSLPAVSLAPSTTPLSQGWLRQEWGTVGPRSHRWPRDQ